MKLLLSIIFSGILFISCKTQEINPDSFEYEYAFLVAGHVYGHPVTYQYGFHSPFKAFFEELNEYPKMDLGILTGDVVPIPDSLYWDAAQNDIQKINMPIHIAPGNHDRGAEFEKRFQKYYYSFKTNEDLFIILSPNNWNIDGNQKTFLQNTIDSNYQTCRNIFIFCHELIWWSPTNAYKNVEINYRPHFPGSTNFWDELKPMFDSIPNEVIFFAGDVGASERTSPFMYHKINNLTLIASGMGSGIHDNIIAVEINSEGKINYNLIHLNGDNRAGLGKLTDYVLP